MNKRIKELIEQSYLHDVQNDSTIFLKEKFAELIIKECIAVHEDNYGIDIIGDILNPHFGIEK